MALLNPLSKSSLPLLRRLSTIVDTPILSTAEVLRSLNTYTETHHPNEAQLEYAYKYFTSQSPQFLFGTSRFREFPDSTSPEITFLGRSNVGKSSLLNALFNRPNDKLAYVSKRPGRTRAMNAFGIGGASTGGQKRHARPGMSLEIMANDEMTLKKGSEMRNFIGRGGLVVVDLPGYGHGSREEWGKEVVKYLQMRKQLRRAFLLIDAEHGVKSSDQHMLDILQEAGTPHQIILSKSDKLIYPTANTPSPGKLQQHMEKLHQITEKVREKVVPKGKRGNAVLNDIVCCSSAKTLDRGRMIGMDEVRWAVLQAAGLQCDVSGRKGKLEQLGKIDDAAIDEDGMVSWEAMSGASK
ncbi:uncharacterized protein E2P81_ATG08426 [Venturia nashicola]|uniref:GTP-binding protein 8 n=1 Tax=Venturia nashicola TaxID=86259 RepID=A0A4Z1NVT2_9PEZI|nr:hypothetical protein E6O75_ATG08615 [Venturia nashicola]TLD21838.1 uncharacterized protein E2P81_ATG08426 [Venturia nashicola]